MNKCGSTNDVCRLQLPRARLSPDEASALCAELIRYARQKEGLAASRIFFGRLFQTEYRLANWPTLGVFVAPYGGRTPTCGSIRISLIGCAQCTSCCRLTWRSKWRMPSQSPCELPTTGGSESGIGGPMISYGAALLHGCYQGASWGSPFESGACCRCCFSSMGAVRKLSACSADSASADPQLRLCPVCLILDRNTCWSPLSGERGKRRQRVAIESTGSATGPRCRL